MDTEPLQALLSAYRAAPPEFQATPYWQAYEADLIRAVSEIDVRHLRSGRYPILATIAFNDTVHSYHPGLSRRVKWPLRFLREVLIRDRPVLPYSLSTPLIRSMAYRHCELVGELCGAEPVSRLEMSTFGGPSDLFEVEGRRYSVQFLSFYLRYAFAHRHVHFTGQETYVELGSGSCYQVEVLKRLYPDMTVFCFDLPAQLYLGETYLTGALGDEHIVSAQETLDWKDLSDARPGKVHFLGNWQIPLVQEATCDIFWNAASFGEMEPDIVRNYLEYVTPATQWVYLLQARHGKETSGKIHVNNATTFDNYRQMLDSFELIEEADAYQSHRPMTQSGGYFQALWRRSG